jgi:hypothetical protein
MQLSGGNSSETNNGITIAVVNQAITGMTHPGARMGLYKTDFVPYLDTNPVPSAVADDSGYFTFGQLSAGSYNLLAYDAIKAEGLFVSSIPVTADSSFQLNYPSYVRLGFLQGTATTPDGNPLLWGYVFIPGSPFYVNTGDKGNFLLGEIPEGEYILQLRTYSQPDSQPVLFPMPVPGPANLLFSDSSQVTILGDTVIIWHR